MKGAEHLLNLCDCHYTHETSLIVYPIFLCAEVNDED